MFRECYRGFMPVGNRRSHHRARWPSAQLRSGALNVAEVPLGELADSGPLNCVRNVFAMTQSLRRISEDESSLGESAQVSIHAWSANPHHGLQLADGSAAEERQLAQNFGLSPVAHEACCHLHFLRKFRSNEIGHGSILPDDTRRRRLFSPWTLLLIDRVCAGSVVR
jgi:hypothetical protein